MLLKLLLIFSIFIFLMITPDFVSARDNQFITVVNPVRISRHTENPSASVAAQYEVVSQNKLPATWLLTYDAMENNGVISLVRKMDINQEFGIFMEVTPNLAEASGVVYNNTGFWHHATSVFLSGYTQEERIKLIDKVFEKFKGKFGYYPTSAGAWWVDSFSLEYMKNEYGITANLGVTDQFSTDGYQVWGQYWSVPFYPSKKHAGVPASNLDNKIDVVTTQWAPRDPLNGYRDSLHSTQDYPLLKLSTDYFEKLVDLYAKKHNNTFGQVVVGLEADLDPEGYGQEFANQMRSVSKRRETGEFQIITMREFSKWYRRQFPDISPAHTIVTRDFLDKPQSVIWYQSPQYRIGMVHDHESGETSILDLRVYSNEMAEPYYVSPNKAFTLSINIPSVLDNVSFAEEKWRLQLGKLRETKGDFNDLELDFDSDEQITFRPDRFSISGILNSPKNLINHPGINIEYGIRETTLRFSSNSLFSERDLVFSDLKPEATHFVKQRKVSILIGLGIILLIASLFLTGNKKVRILPLFLLALMLMAGWQWYSQHSTRYLVPQGERDALYRLAQLPFGNVVVYDQECLQCSWHTKYPPAAFANKRGYVQKYGKHPIIYNASMFNGQTRVEARREFKKTNAKYIYVVKFEDYREEVPFSPGDLGIEKIYENANAQIWRVKEK